MQQYRLENDTSFDSVSRRIAYHAAASPQQIAVVNGTRHVTYSELERRSNQLAALLQKAGAGPERCVGVFLERSADFIISTLAIFKSGAAYVPVDPSMPIKRLNNILDDAGAIALITSAAKMESLPSGCRRIIAIDACEDALSSRLPSPIDALPDTLAYVIYTSGSTGQPKGVEVTHANLLNLIDWHQHEFGVTRADRASHVAALSFDASVWEIWPYLTAGATIHIAGEVTRRSADTLHEWILAQGITIGFVPTALAEQLFEMAWPAKTPLRMLLTGGDTLRRRPPPGLPFTVVNNYGPTECTVVATSGVVPPGDDREKPSIGRPIANATALILDDSLRSVHDGEIGELCIGGALVSRGYRNLPELTESRFVTYLSRSGEPARIYRTGDRARFLNNGEIEFVGRSDDQVKVRGYRIELGEIVECLHRCPGIQTATVTVAQTAGCTQMLVAYVVPAQDVRPIEADVRAFLAAYLPDYMIPGCFVVIPSLPLMASGKVDKSALPTPCAENLLSGDALASSHAPEENALQSEISELVASLLQRSSIGTDENFFLVGGHSMLGVQLVAQIRDRFGVKLTLRQLFTSPTISALSAEVARLNGTA